MVEIRRVLFPTDFSDLSLYALEYARSVAGAYQAELHVLHVVDEAFQYWVALGPNSLPVGPHPDELVAGSTKAMTEFAEKHLSGLSNGVKTEVRLGRPFLEIARYAAEHRIDLIVLGTHGRGALSHVLLGSVAEKVVRKAPCPVLTIRDPSHEFVMP